MIFAVNDDSTITVLEGIADVRREYEPVDVESGEFRFYDESGTYLEPRFSAPIRKGCILGALDWGTPRVFELVPNPDADVDPFALALFESSAVNPNPWFTSLEHLKAELARRGVEVERVRDPADDAGPRGR